MKCPNCGREISGDRCPYCGWSARPGGGSRVAAVIIAVLLALPCAAFGACSVWATASTLPDIGRGGEGAALFMGLLAVASIAGLVGLGYLVRKLWKG